MRQSKSRMTECQHAWWEMRIGYGANGDNAEEDAEWVGRLKYYTRQRNCT